MILTAGAVDCHVHLICPQQIPEALAPGVTTMIGGGTGPAEGTKATTVTPGAWYLARMLESLDAVADERRAARQGQHRRRRRRCTSRSRPGSAGSSCTRTGARRPPRSTPACGWPTRPACRWRSTPTRSTRPATSQDTLAAIAGRGIHAYHTEGAGGGHAPDIITVAGAAQRAAVARPTRPARTPSTPSTSTSTCSWSATTSTPTVPEDLAFAESPHPAVDDRRRGPAARPRRDLDDRLGLAGDGPGRRGGRCAPGRPRTSARSGGARCPATGAARQPAGAPLRRQVHDLPGDRARARRRGRARSRSGKLADLVLWQPAFFGVRPSLVIKGGMIAYAAMGDANASIPTPQPVLPAADVRGRAGDGGRDVGALRRAGGARRRPGRPARRCGGGWCRCATPGALTQGRHARQRRAAADRGRARHVHGAHRRRGGRGRACASSCRWPSATSCSERCRSGLLLLADSRLPSGGHGHSGGVEALVDRGLLRTEDDLAAVPGGAARDRRGGPGRGGGCGVRAGRVAVGCPRATGLRTAAALRRRGCSCTGAALPSDVRSRTQGRGRCRDWAGPGVRRALGPRRLRPAARRGHAGGVARAGCGAAAHGRAGVAVGGAGRAAGAPARPPPAGARGRRRGGRGDAVRRRAARRAPPDRRGVHGRRTAAGARPARRRRRRRRGRAQRRADGRRRRAGGVAAAVAAADPALLPADGSPLLDVLAQLHRSTEVTLFAS